MLTRGMAQIRIVDDWRRSPAAGPSHYRSVMVIAEKWAEQRVLMRAFAESRDPLRPTIVLHGVELAIGPAGLDLHGPWGIHVGDNPEGRAHEIKLQLETTARRVASPRLADEPPAPDRPPEGPYAPGAPYHEANGVDRFRSSAQHGSIAPYGGEAVSRGAPGAPRALPMRSAPPQPPPVEHVTPVGAARIPQVPAATYVPQAQAQHGAAPGEIATAPSNPELRKTPLPRARSRTRQPPLPSSRTVLGYTSGSGAQSAVVRLGLAPHVSARLGRLVDRVVPADFHLDPSERRVLNALGEGELTARGLGQMLDVADPVTFMDDLTRKLESYNLDLVEPGDPHGGEPTYRLRR